MSYQRQTKYPAALWRKMNHYALTATLVSESAGDNLTYAWSGPAAITFGTSTAATTTIAASAPGAYAITLTIADSDGNTDSYTETLNLDRVLYVGGDPAAAKFDKLQDAIDWINANDIANVQAYTIAISGTTKDTARIVPNRARVYFNAGGILPVGVDFAANGSYQWAGVQPVLAGSFVFCGIQTVSGHAITVSASGVTLVGFDFSIRTTDAAGAGVFATAGNQVNFQRCAISGGLSSVQVSGVPIVRFLLNSISGFVSITDATNPTSFFQRNDITLGNVTIPIAVNLSNFIAVNLSNFNGVFAWNKIVINGTSTGDLALVAANAPANANYATIISNNVIWSASPSVTIISAIRVIAGSGVGLLRIANNTLESLSAGGIGLHFVGVPPANYLIAANEIEGTLHAINSTNDAAATVALPLVNAKLSSNTIKGNVTNVTFAAGTPMPGNNIQV